MLLESLPAALLDRLQAFEPTAIAPKWIDRKET